MTNLVATLLPTVSLISPSTTVELTQYGNLYTYGYTITTTLLVASSGNLTITLTNPQTGAVQGPFTVILGPNLFPIPISYFQGTTYLQIAASSLGIATAQIYVEAVPWALSQFPMREDTLTDYPGLSDADYTFTPQ